MNQTYLERFAELSLSGVDFDQDGLGGLECKFHVSTQSRIVETILGVLCAVVSIKLGLETKTHDGTTTQFRTHPDHRGYGRAVSLVLLTFVFGIEVGFKLVSRTLIFLLFPCHIVTVVWIYLLATPPSTFNNNIYRVRKLACLYAHLGYSYEVRLTNLLLTLNSVCCTTGMGQSWPCYSPSWTFCSYLSNKRSIGLSIR